MNQRFFVRRHYGGPWKELTKAEYEQEAYLLDWPHWLPVFEGDTFAVVDSQAANKPEPSSETPNA